MAHELGGDVIAVDHREYGPANVTITADGRAVRRPRARAAGLDEPRRLDHAPARGLPRRRPRPTPRRTPAWRPRSATCTASSSTPRSSTRRAAATSCATSSSASPAIAPTWTPANFIDTTVAGIRERVDAHARETGFGRARHLRAVGRGRLGRRGGARPSRGRRPADLHLRRPRADAQEGIGAAPASPSSATSG